MGEEEDDTASYLLLIRLLRGGTFRPVRAIFSSLFSLVLLPLEEDVATTMDIDGEGVPAAPIKVSGGEGEVSIM